MVYATFVVVAATVGDEAATCVEATATHGAAASTMRASTATCGEVAITGVGAAMVMSDRATLVSLGTTTYVATPAMGG